MAMFWVTEVLPLPITGMIPVVLYPLMGIMSTNETCLCYMNDTTMMFLGSLVIAVVIENSGLHMRMALLIIKTIGCSHRRYFIYSVLLYYIKRPVFSLLFKFIYKNLCPLANIQILNIQTLNNRISFALLRFVI